jgi:hypothetical protein
MGWLASHTVLSVMLKRRSSASATQERGRARRLALQDAAALLLDDQDIDTLALTDVCAAAGIPKVRAIISIATFIRSMSIWPPGWKAT